MVKLVFIRGAPAVGKTTITRNLLALLKREHGLRCAYVCEDDFRKRMQGKYKAADLVAHQNSFELIKTVILKLLELDEYDLVFIEGQFRYEEIIDAYERFAAENGFESLWFQFELDLAEMQRRDFELRNRKSEDIEAVKKDIDAHVPEGAIVIETRRPIEESVREVLERLA